MAATAATTTAAKVFLLSVSGVNAYDDEDDVRKS
jgi:hypothetical protein